MKKFKQLVMEFGAPVLALALPVLVSAQVTPSPLGNGPTAPITNVSQFPQIVCAIIGWIFWALIVLTVIFVLVAAFKYLTAAGNPEKISSAGSTLIYAAVAVVVALIAKGLPILIASFLGSGFAGTGC